MSANPQPANPPIPYPEPAEADGDAMFASVVWVHQQRSAGHLERYEGMYIMVLGEQILDADRDSDQLAIRIEKLGGSIPLGRAVMQYVPRPEDWNWK